MKEKHQIIIRVILVFLLIIGSLIFKVIPEYKETQGSSDKFIAIDKYTDIVEIDAGWKTVFVYLWAVCFYMHRQKKWIKLLRKTEEV